MPTRPKTHRPMITRPQEDRPNAHARGYGIRWQRYRKAYLARHPLCVECQSEGRTVAATVVDHVIPHRGDMGRFWDPCNHQSLCKQHHDAKTARGQ